MCVCTVHVCVCVYTCVHVCCVCTCVCMCLPEREEGKGGVDGWVDPARDRVNGRGIK